MLREMFANSASARGDVHQGFAEKALEFAQKPLGLSPPSVLRFCVELNEQGDGFAKGEGRGLMVIA